ncbi:inactive histone-lysine N-methyltransferase 2E-like isoform X2 [Anthonomus grandis grandis]|uniref:inactive histone-lysine N-methyltransferase 2E-like isoform X2 n=1 Tax=Anthonomus grandis grandis TaxID=2921223 RepID=UPI0021665FE4|nr:inactive histone-lysine N-methyltransferase 2E-like isoform X2 [Anthonomus grandis grandis]
MSVCVETSTAAQLIQQPVAVTLSTLPEVILPTSSSTSHPAPGPVSLTIESAKIKPEQLPLQTAPKSIAKLVVTTPQHGASTITTPVLQKVVNSPLITVLNSTGPLTVVKSLCVSSVVSTAPHYTLVNTAAPLNVTNAAGKPPTITVLNCASLASQVTVVKTITAPPPAVLDKQQTDVPAIPAGTIATAVIENRGHNVFVKNTCPDSGVSDVVAQGHKLLTAANFSTGNVISNITAVTKPPSTANGQRSKLKILSNVQIASGSQPTNVILNKTPGLPQPRFNVTSAPNRPTTKLMGVNANPPAKYLPKSPNNVIKSTVAPALKSPQDKPPKMPPHPPMQKGPLMKTVPQGNFSQKQQPQQQQQSIKTLSPQHKNIPGQMQRTGSGLRTIPPQRPQKVATKTNYIGKHAVQAQKVKHTSTAHAKLKPVRPPTVNMYGGYHHSGTIHEKQLTFNQALTAQIIETLSNTSAAPPPNRFETSRYDSAFNCPTEKQVITESASAKPSEDKAKSGLDALSLICQAVLLDHNYNATLPSEQPPPRQTPPINTQAQINGVPPISIYSSIQSKRRIMVPPSSLIPPPHSVAPTLVPSNNVPVLGSDMNQRGGGGDDDAASDISDISDRKHDTEGEETDTAPEAEDVKNEEHYGDYVTRCICGYLHDDGYMVECDKCKVWQHVQCVVKNKQIPDEYLCEECDPTKPVDRSKARLIQQQWIRERQLIEPKIRKEAKMKDTLRNKDHNVTDSDSSDGEQPQQQQQPMVRHNNLLAKNRLPAPARRKPETVKTKKDNKEPIRRQKRKEKKIVKRKTKLQSKQPQQQQHQHTSHSDDENQDTWSANLPQLRQWIEEYEVAVTNHYSPELRARISSIRVNGAHVDSSVNYDETVCNCRIHTQPLTEIKYLVSTVELTPNTPIIELRGKYMLSTQHRHQGGSLTTRQHTQRPGPFVFFYRLHKDNTEVCVDTRTYGNSARFIRRSCKPNAELRHCIEKGVLHLYIVAITDVDKNCELTIKHESHDLAAVGTTQIACACGKQEECSVNKTSIKKNGETQEVVGRKRRGRRTISANLTSPDLKSPVKEIPPPTPICEPEPVPPPVIPPPPPAEPPVAEPEVKKEPEAPEEHKIDEKVKEELHETAETKMEVKEEPVELQEEPKSEPDTVEEKKEDLPSEPKEEPSPPSPPAIPVKTEIKKEKVERPLKEERAKSPPLTPISTRRASHHKSDKEDSSKESDGKEKSTSSTKCKKLSREERKLEAILRAIEQMEKAESKKQEHQAKQANRRESEPGANNNPPAPKEEEKPEPKAKRRRRRGRARTTSTSTAHTRRSRLNSTDSYMTSGDENLLSPNDSGSAVAAKDNSEHHHHQENKAAGLLLALSNGDPENGSGRRQRKSTASAAQEHDSSSNSAHSSPETPQLSSACLLVQAAVETVESGFKFPKTKKGLMNEWLNKTPDPVQPAGSVLSSSLLPHLGLQGGEESSSNSKSSSSSTPVTPVGEGPSRRGAGNAGYGKKRWLRQAISEDHSGDSPVGRPDSPPISDAVAPPKKRKLPRESLSNDNSPPNTPTNSGPPKFIDTPRTSQEGFENVYSGAEGDSPPSHILESDAELKERAVKMRQELEIGANTFADDRRTSLECSTGGGGLFCGSEHLVGTVEKTLSIFGFESNSSSKPQVNLPVKRKLSITEYRQRKRQTTDKTDDQEGDNETHEDNSSESFKGEMVTAPKTRSRSSSSSSSLSSFEDLSPSEVVLKAPVFNCEPTELERQREISSLRLKKAFGLPINDESRKPPVIDMASILNCDLEHKIKPSSYTPLACYSDLSMSPTLRAPDRTFTPLLPPIKDHETDSSDKTVTQSDDCTTVEKEEEVDRMEIGCDKEDVVVPPIADVEMKVLDGEDNTTELNLFYTPDDEEERPGCSFKDPEVTYVPPFNNPVYPNSNFGSFSSALDDDPRYQSRNPSPPPPSTSSVSSDYGTS